MKLKIYSKFFVRTILSYIKKPVKKIVGHIWPEKKELVFLFSNKSKYWTGIGKDLYEHEPVFMETVQKCDKIIREISNYTILSNFDGDADDRFFDDEGNVGFTVTTIQIALTELYKSKNIIPSYISGISLGEFAAVYAAGGITMRETLILTHCAINLLNFDKKEYVAAFAFGDTETIQNLCKKSPLWVVPLIYLDVNAVVLNCHKDDFAAINEYFNANQILCKKQHGEPYWPFHTELISRHKSIVDSFVKQIDPKPLNCDYYSATYGKVISKKNIIPADYWYNMLRKPVLLNEVMDMLRPIKNLVLLTVGPHFSLKTLVQNLLNGNLVYLDSMTYNTSALKTFRLAYKTLKNLRLDKRNVSTYVPVNNYKSSSEKHIPISLDRLGDVFMSQ